MRIFRPTNSPFWLEPVLTSIERGFGQVWRRPLLLRTYAVNELPPPSEFGGGLVYVSNESGGAVPAFSDGAAWRRVTDRTIIS